MGQPAHRGTYPSDWSKIARSIKDEVGNKCVRCKTTHSPSLGYTLTVHHFDGDKSNCERWNLMPLCQRCHLSVQARVDPEVPLMFDPSLWSMPYIAGFYEAGNGVPGPTYDLARWMQQYTAETNNWPAWAPTKQEPPQ